MDSLISIREVADSLLRHPMLKDVTLEEIVDHTQAFIRILGCDKLFMEKVEVVDIINYRALLPSDLVEIIQVRTDEKHFGIFKSSTDSFHMSEHKTSMDLTYRRQGKVIITSIPEGRIEIAYLAIPVDSEGYPMIPDLPTVKRALESYIKNYYFNILFDMGKIGSQVLQNAQQQYSWQVAQAISDLHRITVDEWESIANAVNKMIPDGYNHDTGYAYANMREYIKLN